MVLSVSALYAGNSPSQKTYCMRFRTVFCLLEREAWAQQGKGMGGVRPLAPHPAFEASRRASRGQLLLALRE